MHKSNQSAFSLVEIMIVVAILADVLIIAVPAFLRARNLAQNTKFINGLRTASAGFEMYAAENNRYPAAAAPGTLPAGMNIYLTGVTWSDSTPIGGRWSWAPAQWGSVAQLGVSYAGGSSIADDVRMADIDTRMDNGVLSTGAFRKRDSANYMQIIE